MKPGVAMAVMIDVPHVLEIWSVFSSDLFDRKFMISFKKLIDEDTLSGMVQPDNDSSSPHPRLLSENRRVQVGEDLLWSKRDLTTYAVILPRYNREASILLPTLWRCVRSLLCMILQGRFDSVGLTWAVLQLQW